MGGVGIYFEAAAVIVVLVPAWTGARAPRPQRHRQRHTRPAQSRAGHGAPRRRRRRTGGAARSSDERRDRSRVRPGDKVPVDGVVVEGTSNVDESMLTRRIASRGKSVGRRGHRRDDQRHGQFPHARRDRVGDETMLARIVQMVAEAQRSRAPIQALADQRRGLVRAGRARRGGAHLRRLVSLSARSRGSPTRSSMPWPCSSSRVPARLGWRRRCRSWSALGAARRRACS